MLAVQLTQTPLRGKYVSMQWLECLSKREEVTLKLDDKEYACVRFITRPRYLDDTENAYETSEFYFCPELPGVPFRVERAVVTPTETQYWSQLFESTKAPE
jgi:DNA-binding GntR family transcriptional regulator